MEGTIYYGVYVPNDLQFEENPGSKNVFLDKMEALKEVKKYKKARFKAFQFFHEAIEFSLHGSEYPNNNSSLSLDLSSSSNESTSSSAIAGERPTQFRGPKSQDLVKFRKAIENGDMLFVSTIIWENPRYLISSGDTPAILQEGFRYNALHVAAKADNAEICNLILTTVSLPTFIQLLYGEENRINSEESSKILLDLYLNTPEKGFNETPLHFAVKFGHVKVVEVLISYPQCDKHLLNKYSFAPKDIICNRLTNPRPVLIKKIASFLEEQFYVPVVRSEDNSMQPIIGEPFSPQSPPKLNQNVIEPRKEIHAYAGPMKHDEAIMFRRKWKTPPRSSVMQPLRFQTSTPQKKYSNNNVFEATADCRLQDTEKGLERVGRQLARKCNVGWKEYWPFLGTFVDLTTEEGLQSLESYLQRRISAVNADKETAETTTITAALVISPVTDLCNRFDACTLADNSPGNIEQQTTKNANYNNDCVFDAVTEPDLSPFLCIEKSFQVFANRIAYHLLFQMDTVSTTTLDTLELEIKHLKLLISNFLEDPAFKNIVDVQSVHSRIAYLISSKLQQALNYQEELEEKISQLENIITKYDLIVDLFSSDDEEIGNYRQPVKIVRKKSTTDSKQVICLIENVLKCLNYEIENSCLNVNTEQECIAAWGNSLQCACVWKTNKISRRVSFRKTSVNKLLSKLSNTKISQNQVSDNIVKKLSFEDNESPDNVSNVDDPNSFSDEYFSAQNSPITSDNDDNDEVDTESYKDADNYLNIFIESNVPTKLDFDVYDTIKNIPINSSEYLNIFLWQHSLESFLNEQKQKNLGNLSTPTSTGRRRVARSIFNRPCDNVRNSPQFQSWMRITGENSPIKTLMQTSPLLHCDEYYS